MGPPNNITKQYTGFNSKITQLTGFNIETTFHSSFNFETIKHTGFSGKRHFSNLLKTTHKLPQF